MRDAFTGVNMIGRLQSDIGLGEAARQTMSALRLSRIDVYEAALDAARLPHRVNLVYTGFPLVLQLPEAQKRWLKTGRHTIAQFYWELPRLKAEYRPALEIADELWVASRFAQKVFSEATDIPVHLVPPPITVAPLADIRRAAFGLPENRKIFYFNFNATSHYARKNPEGFIEAFRRAFGKAHADSPLFVIKSQYLGYYPALHHRLAHLVSAAGGILIDSVMTRQQVVDLVASTDVYVSLHRTEGFGLGMAEAMLLGKPVIATNYSSNTDFMTAENSYPVGYKLRLIDAADHYYQPDFEHVYEVGQEWAEPDIDDAAHWMWHVYENPAAAQTKTVLAAQDIARQYGPAVVGKMMAEKLAGIDLSTLPDVLPPPDETPVSESRWKALGRRLYHIAVPVPARLALRRMRNPDERLVPVLEPQTIRYQAAEELARQYGHPNLVVLGCENRHEINAVAQRFPVTLVDAAANVSGWDDAHNVLAQPWDKPIARAILQQSIIIANLAYAPNLDATLPFLKAAEETGGLSIVSAPQDRYPSLAAFAEALGAAGLHVWLKGYADGLYTVLVGYPEAPFAPTPAGYKVVAFVPAFNEADVILAALKHLISQGVDVYVLDNHSTDGTGEIARSLLGKGVLAVETYPPENSGYIEWKALLQHIEKVSETLDADWIMFHDADEMREGFDPNLTLRDSLYQVDLAGFNAVNYTVLNFQPTDDLFTAESDPKTHFRYREPLVQRDYSIQIKTWKRRKVDLAGSGGHSAEFEGRRVYPFRFLMRHYPIRSQKHGERKIFRERQPRVKDEERAKGWYSHVDDFVQQQSFIRDPQQLARVDERFYEDYLLERLTGVGMFNPDPDRLKTVFITSVKRRLPNA